MLFSFDRENQKWQLRVNLPTFEPGQHPGLLIGADGEDLVFGNDETGMIRLRWVHPPTTNAAPLSAALRE